MILLVTRQYQFNLNNYTNYLFTKHIQCVQKNCVGLKITQFTESPTNNIQNYEEKKLNISVFKHFFTL